MHSVIQNPTKLGLDNNAAVFMRILNVDGREAEACGNATRCLAWALMKNMNRQEIRIETLAGVLDCYLIENDWVKCHMGKISMKPDDIPLSKNINTIFYKDIVTPASYHTQLQLLPSFVEAR